MGKQCEICGSTYRVSGKNGKFKMNLCMKHTHHMERYGYIIEKTHLDADTSACSICGSTIKVSGETGKFKKPLCVKHRHQLNRYGKIFDKTIYDNNKIIEYENYSEFIIIILHNQQSIKIDTEDVLRISNHRWVSLGNKGKCIVTRINGETVPIEEFITGIKGKYTYKNKDVFDFRKDNLLLGTHSQRCANSKKPKNNTSGYKGVIWNKRSNKWKAQIKVDGKCINLREYIDINDAIAARKQAEEKYFGDFAYDESRDITLEAHHE